MSISVERCRKLLGPRADHMTDGQIAAVREQMYALARVVVDAYADVRQQVEDFDVTELNLPPATWERVVAHFRASGIDLDPDGDDWTHDLAEEYFQ